MSWKASELASVSGGVLRVASEALSFGARIDSREVGMLEMFFAFEPEVEAREAHLQMALERGASAVLASSFSDRMVALAKEKNASLIEVSDLALALTELGKRARERFPGKVIALTGSAGKSTTRQLIHALLSRYGTAVQTLKNFNNHLGVPLSFLSFPEEADYAVVELGANHEGEIFEYTRWVKPDVALILNAEKAHVGMFGSTEQIVKAKGEILTAHTDSKVVLNADSPHFETWLKMARLGRKDREIFTFGSREVEAFRGVWVLEAAPSRASLSLRLQTPEGARTLELPLVGGHQAANFSAALAVLLALGLSLSKVQPPFEFSLPQGRLSPVSLRVRGRELLCLDDTYNGSFESFKAAFSVLSLYERPYFLVLGDMSEVGAEHEALHLALLPFVQALKPRGFFGIGPGMSLLSSRLSGVVHCFGFEADEYPVLCDKFLDVLLGEATECGSILVKASRAFELERLVSKLKALGD